jgi:serine protease
MRVALAAGLASCFLALACFEIEPPPADAGVAGAALSGRILVVGQQSAAASAAVEQGMRRTRSALVRLQEGGQVRPEQLGPAASASLAPTRRPLPVVAPEAPRKDLEWVAGEVLVVFERHHYRDKAQVQQVVVDVARQAGFAGGVEVRSCSGWMLCLVGLTDPEGKPLSLADTEVVSQALHQARGAALTVVSRNFIKRAFRVPNDPYYVFQWHFDFARLQTAWDITTGSNDVVVAIIDSGLKLNHPDIVGKTVPGMDMISNPAIAGDGNGRDPDPTDPGDQALGNGQHSWHGTHVTGTIGANTNNSLGVAGILWQGRMLPVRVLGMGAQGNDFDILSGILWSVGDPDIEDVPPNQNPAKVLNLSLGGPADPQGTQTWSEILNSILSLNKDVFGRPLFVTAAGNANSNTAAIVPANIPGVITVGATRYDGRRAEYSNWGAHIDVMAPGGQVNLDQNQDGQPDGVLSLFDNAYDFEQGTSMAAPHVSGIVGLLASVSPGLDQAQVLQLLRQTANPAGTCNEGCGAGHVDATALLLQAGGVVQQEPLLAVDATRLIFQPGETTKTVNIVNLGSAVLEWTAAIVGAQAALYTVSPLQAAVQAGAAVPATVTLSRGAFGAGSANLQFIGAGAATNQLVRVDLFFNDDAMPVQTNLNVVEVSAYRVTDDGQNLALGGPPALARREQGFAWRLEGLAPGTYYVFAVGDDNNDGIFDTQSESFGAWPLTTEPEAIEVKEATSYTGIEFGLSGGFRLDGVGGVGAPCGNQLDCSFAADADCIIDWPGGYCTRLCDDGFCGASSSCEILECDVGPCNVCLSTCVSVSQCRGDESYFCDPFGTCTPQGF